MSQSYSASSSKGNSLTLKDDLTVGTNSGVNSGGGVFTVDSSNTNIDGYLSAFGRFSITSTSSQSHFIIYEQSISLGIGDYNRHNIYADGPNIGHEFIGDIETKAAYADPAVTRMDALGVTTLTVFADDVVVNSAMTAAYANVQEYQVNDVTVVREQQAAIADADSGTIVAQFNALLARLRSHGLIAT